MSDFNYKKGSEWRMWDLHIHTPASFHWEGPSYNGDLNDSVNEVVIDEMIDALNTSKTEVFSISDYWTFDGWFALKHRLSQPEAPKLEKTVFPGIELRLVAPMDSRLNAHVIFSDNIDDQTLIDFKAQLVVAIVNRPLSDTALVLLARNVGVDKLQVHGFSKDEVDVDDSVAFRAGAMMAEITCESYKDAIAKVPEGLAVGFMPFSTNDGLAQVKWQQHYAYVMGLFKSSPIFETRNHDLWAAFAGVETDGNSAWLDSFQSALGDTPRLAVSGSDAHRFVGIPGDNNKRGYGDYPSGKVTWIKADPTFQGLLHAIKEPAKRSFIGDLPKKLKVYRSNKSLFIDAVKVSKFNSSDYTEQWLDGTEIYFNHDLVAIIGNKGSGKSALADIVALLGNSKQQKHFSFLRRFRGRNGNPAKQFSGDLQWANGSIQSRQLDEDVAVEHVELVRYIPQGHFEELCNEHVTGKSMAFENELRSVIFSHVEEATRLGALDFDQLIEQQEGTLRSSLEQVRGDLRKLNLEIMDIEEQLAPEIQKELEEKLKLKKLQIVEHDLTKPVAVEKPTGELNKEQLKVSEKIELLAKELQRIREQRETLNKEETEHASKLKAAKNIREKALLFNRRVQEFKDDLKSDLEKLQLQLNDFLTVKVDIASVEKIESPLQERLFEIRKSLDGLIQDEKGISAKQNVLKEQLDAPHLSYQKFTEAKKDWDDKLGELIGDTSIPETFKGIEARISQLVSLPETRDQLLAKRLALTAELFDLLDAQRRAREGLFEPVQKLISSNSLIRDDHRLKFVAELGCNGERIADDLFALIKQNSGEFRGESESINAVKEYVEQFDFNKRDDVLQFVIGLHKKVEEAARSSSKDRVGIAQLMRVNRDARDVYDMIFGLTFLKPRYTLLFQDAHIEQLSPGQRGALLLIFYLLVDKGQSPIILDQPEENLDNETVVSLLVPVLNEAKERRQIIMVTHNPNLAVVCDAEQVIHCNFDRMNSSNITYTAGSIENPETNKRVIDVLEGTMPAFNNRKVKYAVHL